MLCCCLLLEESGFFVSSQEKMSEFDTNFCCSHKPALIISPTNKALKKYKEYMSNNHFGFLCLQTLNSNIENIEYFLTVEDVSSMTTFPELLSVDG